MPHAPEVLLVEEDPAVAQLIETLLTEGGMEGVHFTHVTGLQQARDLLEHHSADALVLDLALSDAPGRETLSELAPREYGIPVVVMAGRDDTGLRELAADLGAIDFMNKEELDPDRLAHSIEAALSQTRLNAEVARARAEARAVQAELAELIVRVDVPVLVMSAKSRVLYANMAAGRLMGVTPSLLRGRALPVPLEAIGSEQVELSDVAGRRHAVEVSVIEGHWHDRPAFFVLLQPRVCAPEAPRALPSAAPGQVASTAAAASELNAQTLRLGAWLACTQDHQAKLADLAKALTTCSGTDHVKRNRIATRRVLASLATQARQALANTQNELVKVRRLAMFLQRELTHGRSVELHSADAVVEQACRSVRERLADHVDIVVETATTTSFPPWPDRARELVEGLLEGLTMIACDLGADPLTMTVRTRAATGYALVAVDAQPDASAEEFRRRVLRSLVGEAERPGSEQRLARCVTAIRTANGSMRCGSGDDERLWIEVALPDVASSG